MYLENVFFPHTDKYIGDIWQTTNSNPQLYD
jgi:hypothetical protein